MKRTDKSVDNIQPLEIQLGTGWHVTSHTAEGLVLEDSNCGTGRLHARWTVAAVSGLGGCKEKSLFDYIYREGIVGAAGSRRDSQ